MGLKFVEGQSSEELNVSQICSGQWDTQSCRSSVDGLGVQMCGIVQVFV